MHHYGFATDDIERSEAAYAVLGYVRSSEIITDKIQNVKLLFLRRDDTPLLELVEPLSESSPVSAIIKKNKPTLYHSCFEVDNIDESIAELKQKRFVLVSQPVPAIAFNNRRICFLFHKHTGLIELLEKE